MTASASGSLVGSFTQLRPRDRVRSNYSPLPREPSARGRFYELNEADPLPTTRRALAEMFPGRLIPELTGPALG